MRLIDLYHEHYAPARLITANPNTKIRLQSDIKRFSEFLGHAATTADLKTNLVSALLSQMIGKGLAMETVGGTRKKLVALWRFAHQKGFVTEYPDVPAIPEERDPPIAWTEEEVLRLLQACREQKGTLSDVPAHLWWHSLHMVLLDTGSRIGATLKVEWDGVDLERATMLFRASTQKNRRGQLHKLRPETVEDLRLMMLPKRLLVWPLPFSHCTLYYHYAKLLEQAGLPASRKNCFHKMRRTVATWFESKGGNATELLGHASRKHTKDSYLDESQIERPTPASILPAMNEPIRDRSEPKTELERLLVSFLEWERSRVRGRQSTPRARDNLRCAIERFLKLMPAYTVADVTPEAVRRFCDRLAEQASPATFGLYCCQFRRFLTWLSEHGHSVAAAIEVLPSRDGGKAGAA